jgi:DNA-binding NarL/FixJ family response regulator
MSVREAVDRGVRERLSDQAIADLARVSRQRVAQIARKLGLPSAVARRSVRESAQQQALAARIASGLSVDVIAEEMGWTRKQVDYRRLKWGLPVPRRRNAAQG